MCLSDLNPSPADDFLPDFPKEFLFPEPPDPYMEVFWAVVQKLEGDIEWLEAEPRHEGDLLLRYFADQVTRQEDLFEFRSLLGQCLGTVPGSYVVLPLSTEPVFGWDRELGHDA